MKFYSAMIVGISLLLIGQVGVAQQSKVKLVESYLPTTLPEDDKKIGAALSSPTTLAFTDTPLSEVAGYLAKLHGIPIHIDRRALADVGISPDARTFSMTADEVSLQSGLRLMLDQVDLIYVVDQGRLLITTPDAAEDLAKSVFYPCADLIYPAGLEDDNQAQPDADSLSQLIVTTISPETWNGGSGLMSDIQFVENGLVILQSDEIHAKIAALLAALRTAKSLPSDAYDPAPIDAVSPAIAAVLQKLRSSLDKVGSPELDELSLDEMARYLSQLTGAQVLINDYALENNGVSPDQLVTCTDMNNVSARFILNSLSREHDLTYVLNNEVVLITTLEDSESHLVVKVYPVRDLMQAVDPLPMLVTPVYYGNFGGTGRAPEPYWVTATSRLLNSITLTIDPESWDELGGPASLGHLEVADAFVIAQTEQNHAKIARLLQDIRLDRQRRPEVSPTATAKQSEPVLKRYLIPLDDADDNDKDAINQFARLLLTEVDSDSWNDKTLYVRTLGNKNLLVKQSPQTHAKIGQLLGQLYPQSEYGKQSRESGPRGSGSAWGNCYAPELFNQQQAVTGEVANGLSSGGLPPKPQVMTDAVKDGM